LRLGVSLLSLPYLEMYSLSVERYKDFNGKKIDSLWLKIARYLVWTLEHFVAYGQPFCLQLVWPRHFKSMIQESILMHKTKPDSIEIGRNKLLMVIILIINICFLLVF